MKTIAVDENTAVKYRGKHRDINFEVSGHNFRDRSEDRWFPLPVLWATYVLLSEEQHEKFKPRLEGAPWNGSKTFYKKITEEHMDVPAEIAAKHGWNKPYYKIGDDFSHLWDTENRRWELYDRQYLERHVKRVIDFLLDGSAEE